MKLFWLPDPYKNAFYRRLLTGQNIPKQVAGGEVVVVGMRPTRLLPTSVVVGEGVGVNMVLLVMTYQEMTKSCSMNGLQMNQSPRDLTQSDCC